MLRMATSSPFNTDRVYLLRILATQGVLPKGVEAIERWETQEEPWFSDFVTSLLCFGLFGRGLTLLIFVGRLSRWRLQLGQAARRLFAWARRRYYAVRGMPAESVSGRAGEQASGRGTAPGTTER